MNFKKSTFIYLILILAALAAVIISGGCGGSSHHHKSSESGGDSNEPDNYRSEIAERLLDEDNVIQLRDFLDGTVTAKKGDVLLYYPYNGEDITASSSYLSRLNTALNDGAILAFVNITAEDKLVDSIDVYGWKANPYNRADATVEDFNAWVDGLSGLKTITEDRTGTAAARIAANGTTPTKKGVSLRFDFHSEPREYYFTIGDAVTLGLTQDVIKRTHGAWHRETGMNFDITSFHDFGTGADYYAFQVTGQTNPSKQYAHTQIMSHVNTLICDNLLGYNREFAYSASLCWVDDSEKWETTRTPVGTVVKSAPATLNNSVKKSNGFTFSLDGNIGVGYSGKDGLKGDASLKPSWRLYSHGHVAVRLEVGEQGGVHRHGL